MNRLTITLSGNRHHALKEASARRCKTIGKLIDESLEFHGIKSLDAELEFVRRARTRSKLTESEAMKLVIKETRAARRT